MLFKLNLFFYQNMMDMNNSSCNFIGLEILYFIYFNLSLLLLLVRGGRTHLEMNQMSTFIKKRKLI